MSDVQDVSAAVRLQTAKLRKTQAKNDIGRSDRSLARRLEFLNNDAQKKKPAYLHIVQVEDQSGYIGRSDGEGAVRKFYLDVVLALLNCP